MAAHVFDASEPTLGSTRDPIVRNSGPATTSAGPTVTEGGLLFISGGGKVNAYETKTGKLLWQGPLPAPGQTPITYSIDGKQYIAVMSGFGVDARGVQGTLTAGLAPGLLAPVPEGGSIWVFGLKD